MAGPDALFPDSDRRSYGFTPHGNEGRGLLDAIRALADLEVNWNGYGAGPINPQIIAAAMTWASDLPLAIAETPQVVPMTRGRLQLEWHVGARSLELEFESPTTIHYLKWAPTEGIEEEEVVPLSDRDRLGDLIRWVEAGAPHAGAS